MANVAHALKEEISRVARKELKRETAALRKASSTYRSDIATLKRRLAELERQLQRADRNGAPNRAPVTTDVPAPAGTRFSAKSMASQRRRLGISAAECGLLIGASAQSIYNWEEGKARPRDGHLQAIFALRTLGRRQAAEIVESRRKP